MLRNETLAEDAVQDAFLTVWRNAASFVPERAKASTWLLTIVHRRAVDLVRREERRRTEPFIAGSEPVARPRHRPRTSRGCDCKGNASRRRSAASRTSSARRWSSRTTAASPSRSWRRGSASPWVRSRAGCSPGSRGCATPRRRPHRGRNMGPVGNPRPDVRVRARCARRRRGCRVRAASAALRAAARAELAELQGTTALLAYAAPSEPAPAALRAADPRAGSRGALERHPVPACAPADDMGLRSGRSRRCSGRDRPRDLGGRPPQRPRRGTLGAHRAADALAIVAAPGTSHVDLAGANGPLAVGRRDGLSRISDLEKAPAGKTYEAGDPGSKPSPAGLFRGGGSTVVPLSRLVPGSVVAVTVEPKGGMAMPTTTPFITATA